MRGSGAAVKVGLTALGIALLAFFAFKNVVEAVTVTDILVQVQETLPVLRAILTDVQKITQGPLQEIAKSVQKGVDRNSAAAEQLLHHVDQIALDIRGITGGPSNGDIK